MSGIIIDRLNKLIEQHGITQRDLANEVGVTEVSVSRYVHGTRTPRGDILVKIAMVLHTTAEYLTGLDDMFVAEKRRRGYWKREIRQISDNSQSGSYEWITCSVCGEPPQRPWQLTDYCPYCGSRMETR